MDTVKCNRCLVKLPVIKFETKRCGTLRKLCIDCNLKNKTRFKCADCDMKFSSNSQWQRHIDGVHLKLQPFKCNLCEAKFSTKGHLQRHTDSVHLKIQPFPCIQCDMKFSANHILQSHINDVHLQIQLFKCETCDAKFSQNGNLQQHINDVHLNLRPFECNTCEYKFSSRSNLKRHITICTGSLQCSGGEYKIMKVLSDLNLEKNENYLYNTSYWNVRDKSLLRWDFIVNHNESPVVIEFDGEQHFMPVNFGGSIERAEQIHEDVKRRDKIKDDHCKENNIPILRISYLDIDNIEKLVKEFLSKDSSVSTT